jgi:uncharacterized repeat protein (TIGR01451 family)
LVHTKGVFRLPGALIASGALVLGLFGSALPAAAALDDLGPDLSLAMSSSATQVQSGGAIGFTLTVSNTTATVRDCEPSPYPGKPDRCFTYTAGGPVSGVVVQDTLPAGAVFQSASAGGGFVCSASGTTVTCSGGALPKSGSTQITINALAPTLQPGAPNASLTNAATVNPSQAIDERSYSNNSAAVQFTDVAPAAARDLVVTGFSGPASVPAGGQATYTISIANVGNATANNVAVLLDGGNSAFNVVSSSGTAGFTPCYSSPERFSLRAWCPGIGYGPSLAPGATATISVVVQVPASGGAWTMTATVDPLNSVAETNESNNQQQLGLVVP